VFVELRFDLEAIWVVFFSGMCYLLYCCIFSRKYSKRTVQPLYILNFNTGIFSGTSYMIPTQNTDLFRLCFFFFVVASTWKRTEYYYCGCILDIT
jgi:hypothetical protein